MSHIVGNSDLVGTMDAAPNSQGRRPGWFPVWVGLFIAVTLIMAVSSTALAQTPSLVDTMRIVSLAGVAPGDTFNLDVYLKNVDTLGAFNFRIRFDTLLIEPLTDTTGINNDITAEVGTPDRDITTFTTYAAGLPEAGVLTFVAVDFLDDLNDLFQPGAGIVVRMPWRVLSTASPTTTTISFENDPVFAGSFNTMTDYRASIFKRPTLMDGSVTIGDTTVVPPDSNRAPDLPVLASPISVNQGDLVTFNVTATDPDGDLLSLLAISIPSGATFTPDNPVTGRALVTGTFRWTPSFSQSGSFVASFQATDSAGRTSPVRSVTISVTETPTDLLFTPSVAGQDPRGGAPGTIGVVIPIYLTSILPAYGVQFDFVYDASVFTVTQLQVSDRLVGFSIYDNVGETPGRLRVLAFSLSGTPIAAGTSPTLFNVVGNISGTAVPGAYDIVFENAWESINPDPNVASVPLTTSDGAVYVDAFGDANLDTRIDVGDVVAVVGYILNDFTFTQRQFVAADVLPNDTLDVFDLVTILNMIFGSPLFGQPSSDQPATVDLVYDPTDGPGGSYVLSANAPMDIYGAQIELSYDPTVTELGGVFADPEAARVDLRYRDRGDGRVVTLLTYNPFLSDSRIPSGHSTILRIPVISSSVPAEAVRLRSVKFSDGEGRRIEVAGYGGVPRGFLLEQNYPNPFNAGTTVPFTIRDVGAAGAVDTRVEVFNVLGQRVVTLHEGQLTAGHYALHWDGRDGSGRSVASGLYFYRLVSGGQTETRKMVLLK